MLTALVSQTLRFAKVLETVVKRTKLLENNRLLWNDGMLARVLLYDFMIGPGLYKPGRLKVVMVKNKEIITSEFDRLLTAYGVNECSELPSSTTEALPRYVRVNLIKTSVDEVINSFVDKGWTLLHVPTDFSSFKEVCQNLDENQFSRDFHLDDLLVFPAHTDFHDSRLVQDGRVILQDKASCLPAHILSPPEGAVVVDSCAAPGNKTSHMASLMGNKGTIYAFDHKEDRIEVLQERMEGAGVSCKVARCMDFLRVKTDSQTYRDVEYVMVDPSCSGSGIVSRLDSLTNDDASVSQHRLGQLHKLQAQILRHAFSFPNVKKIVYSTCSINDEENEQVCEEIYEKFKERFKIKKVMKNWPERGREGYQKSDRYLRASPTATLTNGFFVACFKRRKMKQEVGSMESGMDQEEVSSEDDQGSQKQNGMDDEEKEGSKKRKKRKEKQSSEEGGEELMEINEKKEKKKKSKKRKRDMNEEETPVKRKEEDMGEKKEEEEEKEEKVLERSVKKRKERTSKSSHCSDTIDIRDKSEKMDAEESIASVGTENSTAKKHKKKKKRSKD